MSEWYLYIIRTRDGCLYTGVTTNLSRRFAEHSSGKQGAKFLRSKGPLQLVYQQQMDSRSDAQRMELQPYQKATQVPKRETGIHPT